ncbi:hypothetical protein GCM10010329_60960 [Streptomyces spiroverticillatus]|uniref:DUF748 domain-containing protein n=1 Tax=Streptomyces finlayi TaxID=67296 RepID=A0A918X443_9ACTN|nr:hypothetical protein [Streptomyces finlayi]GHA29439.1 hypothetical protein GCM10010329_60960 [Streptomyces spiroverticillatus]GHD09869.1 hypothetical protein GCM10010334_64620 [Streptomyces finlayi]
MNTGLRITAYGAAVAATFGAAYGIGKGVGPLGEEPKPAHAAEQHKEPGPGGKQATSPAGGLQISEAGYTLALETPRVSPGERTALRFSIKDAQGRKVTAYEREHEKELHFIVASRDLTVFRHLHPTRAADGTWSTTADLPAAGGYRAFADFKPAKKGAKALTLGADLAVSGAYTPNPLPTPSRTATVDGYQVTLTGALKPGKSTPLTLKVAKNSRPVTDLQPYLGAYGHLVALRSGDLAYLHVHPHGTPGDGTTRPGPAVTFSATAPSQGTYRLFLDFRHEGKVRTAAFTVEAGTAGDTAAADDTAQPDAHDDAHGATDQH